MAIYNIIRRNTRLFYFKSGCALNQKQQIRIVVVCLVVLFVLNIFGDSPAIHKPCIIHKLNPWDETLKAHLTFLPPNNCSKRRSLLYVDEAGFLQYNMTTMAIYSLKSLNCAYQAVYRDGDIDVSFGKEKAIQLPTFIPCRIFRVICKTEARIVYDVIHVNIVWNESDKMQSDVGYESEDHLSVIYIGFDSVSSSEFVRKSPLTYKYLTESLGAYHFRGNMKVGLNTYPNWIALLRGEYGKDLLFSYLVSKTFDDENFIWKDAKKSNYATTFIDDFPETSAFRGKFQNPPTDYYYRPYTLAMEAVEPIIIDKLGKATKQCYGNWDQYVLQLDYMKRFLMKYNGRRKFAFLWNNEFAHDSPHVEKADRYTHEFIGWMKSNGHLDRAILILGSDHGFRLGNGVGASATYVGKLEMNMPALVVYFPKSLKEKYPGVHRRLLQNTEKLVSHYDVYETMKGVINSDFNELDDTSVGNTHIGQKLYGLISDQRSCSDAGIAPNYCTCYEDMTNIDTSQTLIKLFANEAVMKINDLMIKNKHTCVQLTLLNVTEAKISYKARGNDIIYGFKDIYKLVFDNNISGRYRLQFYTQPNMGLFEAALDYDANSSNTLRDQITFHGDPERLNTYGNQSHCVDDSYLKQFCLCE